MDLERLAEFAGNHPALVGAFVLISAALLWTTVRGRFQGFKAVGPMEATQLINHQDAVVLDIRDDNEVKEGFILDSIHIPMSQLQDKVQKLDKFKERPIIASCRSGSRSQAACAALGKRGFTQLYNLQGGILAWQNANLPLVKK